MPNITGGTAAPGVRQNAAARALGAPRVAGQRPQRQSGSPRLPRVGANGQQHGISQHQPQHQVASHPVAQHLISDARAPQRPQAARPARPAPAFNPLEGDLNSAQLAQLAQSLTKANDEPELNSLRQASKQITGAEGTALGRYQGMAKTGQEVQAGLQQGEEASAKTAQNNAADAAMKASKEIETSGQNAATATAGYMDPQVQQALQASQHTSAGLAGSASQFQQAMGVSGANLMSGLRAAAAQRVTEGAGHIQQAYAGAQGKVADEQGKILAKQPGDARSLAVELGQKQFTDAATRQSLGIKTSALGQQAAEARARNQLTARGQNLTAASNREGHRVTERGQSLTRENSRERNQQSGRSLAETERHDRASEKTAAQNAMAALRKGGLTTSQQDAIASEIGTAYATIQQLRTKGVPPAKIREALTNGGRRVEVETEKGKFKGVHEKSPAIKNQILITAAQELWNYHKVNAVTQRQLTAAGITVPPEWTDGSFKGF